MTSNILLAKSAILIFKIIAIKQEADSYIQQLLSEALDKAKQVETELRFLEE